MPEFFEIAHTFADPEGAGDDPFDDEGGDCVREAAATPSGPLTETLGTSIFAALLAAGGAPGLRAPGGTYAFVPRTTAPYLDNTISQKGTEKQEADRLVLFVYTAVIRLIPLFSDVRIT